MAIFHLHSQHIGRGQGRSAVAAAAYRSASKMVEEIVDKESGDTIEKVHDYRNKGGVVFSEVLAPDSSALWMKDRETLWNLVQNKFDTRKDAVFAQEMDLALPVELSQEQNLELLKDFIGEVFTKDGIIVDTNVHYDNEENPHAHLMLSTREILLDPLSGEYSFGKKVRQWSTKEFLVNVRRMWAHKINHHLGLHGLDLEVSHLSYRELGLNLIPGVKEGAGRNIEGSERAALNAEVARQNKARIRENPELIIDMLRKDKAVFTKNDVERALFRFYVGENQDVIATTAVSDELEENKLDLAKDSIKEISRYVSDLDKVLTSEKLVCLNEKDLEGRLLYTNSSRNELEQETLKLVIGLKYSNSDLSGDVQPEVLRHHSLGIGVADLELKSGFFEQIKDKTTTLLNIDRVVLSDLQKKVVLGVLNGENVSVVEGLPGSGKTTVMKEIAASYIKAGYEVIGTAVSASAAVELSSTASIPAMNITKLRYETEKLRGSNKQDFKVNLTIDYWKDVNHGIGIDQKLWHKSLLSAKSVLIVDEASMVDLTEMHWLIREVSRVGAKLILLGDRGQLASVGIKGAFQKIAEIFGVQRLDEVRRQRKESHRAATKLIAENNVKKAIEIFRADKVFNFGQDIDEARGKLVDDYVRSYVEVVGSNGLLKKKIVALSYTNEEVEKLNSDIRVKLRDIGVVYGEEFAFELNSEKSIGLGRGDRIVFNKNDIHIGVFNGDIGTVVGFNEKEDKHGRRETLRVRLDNEHNFLGISLPQEVEVDNFHYKSLSYGFAVNIFKSQGRTFDRVYLLLDKYVGYNGFNVGVTRHVEELSIYAPIDVLEGELERKIDKINDGGNWEIKADEKDALSPLYAGLQSLCTRRDDASLIDDWKGLAFKEEAKAVNNYIQLRHDVISLSKTIDNWVIKGRLLQLKTKEGEIVTAKDHPLYETFKEVMKKRQEAAGAICNNYSKYATILAQANMNYSTIEKHAGKAAFSYSFARNDPDVKRSALQDSPQFKEFIILAKQLQNCALTELFEHKNLGISRLRDLTKSISVKSNEIMQSLDDRILNIEEAKIECAQAEKEKIEAQLLISNAKAFIHNDINAFLEKTYKDSPEVILEKWEKLKSQNLTNNKTLDEILAKVQNDPKMLGALNGIGFGSVLAFTPTRFKATVNMYRVHELLTKYEDYKEKLAVLESNMTAKVYDNNIADKKLVLNKLQIWSSELEAAQFVRSVYDIVHHSVHVRGEQYGIDKEKALLIWSQYPLNNAKINLYNEEQNKTALESTENKISYVNSSRHAIALSFEEVGAQLSSQHYESIFRQYIAALNSDGKIEKSGAIIESGSLKMNLKNGLWYRFSNGEGGNIFSFVSEATGVKSVEALSIVAGHAGISSSPNYKPSPSQLVPKSQKAFESNINKINSPKEEWIPYKVVPKQAPEFIPDKHLKYMMDKNKLGGVYTYKNKEGEVIGHAVRLIDNVDGKKQVLPVSYCRNGVLKKEGWRLKGFDDGLGGKPIYGLEKLKNQEKLVLIVEGEKTADKAQELFPEYNVISWLGGAKNASKVDWESLKVREVVFWPDNDEPGMEAAFKVASIINEVNGYIGHVAIVNPKAIVADSNNGSTISLPKKWDLADELPDSLSTDNIKDAILHAKEEVKDIKPALELASQADNELLKCITWQSKSYGFLKPISQIKDNILAYEKWNSLLESDEIKTFIKYGKAKGAYESSHEFLCIEDKLYKDSLVAIAESTNAMLLEETSDLFSTFIDLEDKYEKVRANFTEHFLESRIYADKLSNLSQDKSEIMEILTRDILLLHKMQIGTDLSILHKKLAKENIYEIIKDYKSAYYRANKALNAHALKDNDKIAIADLVYDKLSSSEWWKSLAEARLSKPKSLENIAGLEQFKEQRNKAQNLSEFIAIMNKEKVYCLSVCRNLEAADLEGANKDNSVINIASYYKANPGNAENLREDANNIEKFGIKIGAKEFADLKTNLSHKNIADHIYSLCKTHVLETVEKNIENFWDKNYIKIEGKKFHSPLAYIKYEIEDRGNARYLHGTEDERDYLDMKQYCKRNEMDEVHFIKFREMGKGLHK